MRQYYVPRTATDALEERIDNEQEEKSACTLSMFFTLSTFLLSLVFLGFLIYAIFKYNTDDVRSACPSLMTFIIIRTVVGLIGLASLGTFLRCSDVGDDAYKNSYLPTVILTSSLVYFLSFTIAGGFVISESMIDNEKCTDLLNDSVFKIPLLGILGWIYVACDGVFTLFFAYYFFINLCSRSETAGADETETMLP